MSKLSVDCFEKEYPVSDSDPNPFCIFPQGEYDRYNASLAVVKVMLVIAHAICKLKEELEGVIVTFGDISYELPSNLIVVNIGCLKVKVLYKHQCLITASMFTDSKELNDTIAMMAGKVDADTFDTKELLKHLAGHYTGLDLYDRKVDSDGYVTSARINKECCKFIPTIFRFIEYKYKYNADTDKSIEQIAEEFMN